MGGFEAKGEIFRLRVNVGGVEPRTTVYSVIARRKQINSAFPRILQSRISEVFVKERVSAIY